MEFVNASHLEAYEHQLEIGRDPLTNDPIHQKYTFYEMINGGADKMFYVFCRGDMKKLRRVFHDFVIHDQRVEVPMQNKLMIKFPKGMTYRPYQFPAIEAFQSEESGLLKAPPRSGKTLMMAATICLEGQKTIIIAHQTDLLTQMYDTFEKFTNLKEIRTSDNPIVGFPNTVEDFLKLDVCLVTKQTFDHINNKELGRYIQDKFGSVMVDEAHFVPGEVYSHFINRFHSKYRRGCTATPARKDGLHFILFEVIGPIMYEVVRTEVNYAPMEVVGITTKLVPKGKKYADILTNLCENEVRNRFIAAWIKKDVEEGRSIFAVTDRREHTILLANMLRDLGIPAQPFNGKFGKKSTRKSILDDMREGRTKVLVSMRQMATGIDIPIADTFYNLTPSSNAVSKGEDAGEGGYEQQCTRVLTPFEGKTRAIVRDFVDETGLSWGAWRIRKLTYEKLDAKIRFAKDGEIGHAVTTAPIFHVDENMGYTSF